MQPEQPPIQVGATRIERRVGETVELELAIAFPGSRIVSAARSAYRIARKADPGD